MPVSLDTIPEKATNIARPSTRRWLLCLALFMLGGIALTLWRWTLERTGFVFWFTAIGLPFCTWGLIFGLRRFAYKAGQVGAESRNLAREALLECEIRRGQRCAWILEAHIQSPSGNKASELVAAMKKAVPAVDFSHPRGCKKPVRYAALTAFQENLTEELKVTLTKLTRRVKGIIDPLPAALPCWLMLDGDEDILASIEKQFNAEFLQITGKAFSMMPGKGLAAFDTWLDRGWDNPGILVAVTISLPAMPNDGEADAVSMVVFSNRRVLSYPDARCLHRPERGTETTLKKTLSRALLWAKVKPEELKGSWFSGTVLTKGSEWNTACESNGVTFSLSEENFAIDSVLGYTRHAAPWLAITLADSAFKQRGVQVIAAQPTADKDDIWVAVITKEDVSKESQGNV